MSRRRQQTAVAQMPEEWARGYGCADFWLDLGDSGEAQQDTSGVWGLESIFERLRLTLHPEKTRLVETGVGKEGFDFLGCHFRLVKSRFKGRTYLFRWPSAKAMKSVRAKIRELTDRRRLAGVKDVRTVIGLLNPLLRGWGNYFRTGNADTKFNQLDSHVRWRLVRYMARRGGQRRKKVNRRPFNPRQWSHDRFVEEHGLHRLRGTVRYPGKVNAG